MNLWKVIVFLVMFNYVCGFELFMIFVVIGSLFVIVWNYCFYECCRLGWVDLDILGKVFVYYFFVIYILKKKCK